MDRSVVEARDPKPSLLGRLLARAGSPLNWSLADRCLIGALLLLPFVAWYAALYYLVLRRPELATYVDLTVLPLAFRAQLAFLGAWVAIAVAALVLRRHASACRVVAHLQVQLYALTALWGSYLFGYYTSLFTGVAVVGGYTVAFILFERWVTLPSVVSFLLGLVTMTIAEQVGLIRYAPLLAGEPYQHGRLSGWWLAGPGAVAFVGLFFVVAVIYYIVERWRRREDELAHANDIISRYVAAQLAEQIRLGNYGIVDRHERRRLTLFFSDIRGFSEIADRVEPEDLSGLLNEYFAEMTTIAERYGATVDKFMGDGIMIFFGAPEAADDRDQAVRAVRMGVEMQGRMGELRLKWSQQGFEEPFTIRIGINTGIASVGSFGARGRMDYTAIGRQVNLAARLQASCEPGRILISHATWALVSDEILCTPRGELQVKGFHRPVNVYEVAVP
jgi:adenylate cyclase